jgi:hypothetical protein
MIPRARRLAVLVALASTFAAFGSPSRAADCGPPRGPSSCIDADNLWPRAGGGPYFALGSTETTRAGGVAVGLVASFFAQPIGVRIASADPAGSTVFLVDKAFDATLLLAFGLTDRFELTLAAPGTLYQTGAGVAAIDGAAPPQPHSPARDLRFGFAVALLEREDDTNGPALAGRLEFVAKAASSYAFAGGRTAVLAPSLTFSYRIGRVDLSAEANARLRGEATLATAVVGPEVGGALGASVDLLKQRWLALGAEAFALVTTSRQPPLMEFGTMPVSQPPLVPAEWIAHVSSAHFARGDLTLGLGGGGTIPFSSHGAFTSPKYRLDLAVRYAPRSHACRRCPPGTPPPPPAAKDPR